jgi:5-methylcytosine-specific restriction enzyme subunit McrC
MSAVPPIKPTAPVLTVESRKSITVSSGTLMNNGVLDIYPQVEEKGYFRIFFAGRDLQLTAGPFVGLIPINPQITIDVRPKLPVANLARVIELADQPIESIAAVHRFYATEAGPTISIVEFLAKNLLIALRDIELRGLYKSYRHKTENSSSPRGRLNFRQTAASNAGRGLRHKVVSSHFEQTLDNPYNRLLKFTLFFLAQRLRRAAKRNRRLVSDVNTSIALFDGVTLPAPGELTRLIKCDINGSLPPERRYYERALGIALTIISNKGLCLFGHGQEVEMSSYIINFETLFENYLRNVLRMRLTGTSSGLRVRDGNEEGKKRLFDDAKKPPATPDIVIDRPPDVLAIVEVKYKDKVDRTDLNQVITYGCSYRTRNVLLVHQAAAGKPSGGQRLGAIGALNVFTYAFDLGNPHLETEEMALAGSVGQIIDRGSQ